MNVAYLPTHPSSSVQSPAGCFRYQLVTDNSVGALMSRGLVDRVVTPNDLIAGILTEVGVLFLATLVRWLPPAGDAIIWSMFHHPGRFLRELTDETVTFPRSFALHALLYRLCEVHAGTLDGCLGETPWQKYAITIDRRTRGFQTKYPRSWLVEVRKQLASLTRDEPERLLVGCSAVLRVLDVHHRALRVLLERQIVELPDRFGGGRMAFLPPPENVIAEAVPPSRMRPFVESCRDFGTDCRGSVFVINSAWLLGHLGAVDDADLFLGYLPAMGSSGPPVKVSEDLAVFSVRVLLADA